MGEDWKDTLGYIKKRMERKKDQPVQASKHGRGVAHPVQTARPPRGQPTARRPNELEPRAAGTQTAGGETAPRQAGQVPLPPAPEPGSPPAINIGLDFGTSTSKVCVRLALGLAEDVPVYPIAFRDDVVNGSQYLVPSAVTLFDGKLYFGWEAEARTEDNGTVLAHLKVCLACDGTMCRKADAKGCRGVSAGPRGSSNRGASFQLGDQEVSARDLVIAYLAWIIGETRTRLPSGLSSRSEARFTCNLGVPIDWLDTNSPLTAVYERIAHSAWLLSLGMSQGIPVTTVEDWILQADRKPLPPTNRSPVQLCPETTAATISYANSPHPQTGLYGLVDVGAWTTDISFFRLTDISLVQGVRTLAFYSARTCRVAADQIDERLCDFLSEIWGVHEVMSSLDGTQDLASLIRLERERGTLEDANVRWKGADRSIPSAAVEVARMLTSSAVRRHFIGTLKEAYAKEIPPQEPKWRDFPILLMGGGSEEACFEKTFRKDVPLTGKVKRVARMPSALSELAGIQDPSICHRLAVSHGLSFPSALWPRFLRPSEVPMPDPPRIRAMDRTDDNAPG